MTGVWMAAVRDERGAGTVFAAFALLALLLLAAGGVEVGGAVAARHRAQSAADLAALAGAARLVAGESAAGGSESGGDACAVAGDYAGRNGASVLGCEIEGADVVVRVGVEMPLGLPLGPVGLGPAVAAARAGPVEG